MKPRQSFPFSPASFLPLALVVVTLLAPAPADAQWPFATAWCSG